MYKAFYEQSEYVLTPKFAKSPSPTPDFQEPSRQNGATDNAENSDLGVIHYPQQHIQKSSKSEMVMVFSVWDGKFYAKWEISSHL